MLDSYQQFIFLRTYARWIPEKKRRETWEEAVERFMAYMRKRLGKKLKEKEYADVQEAILKQEVMPSMRLLWTAGDAVEKSHAMAYNCSFTTPTKLRSFGEILYLLTCGCGVGYSVESKFVNQLPIIKPQSGDNKELLTVPDTREGWADALVQGMKAWYEGKDVVFDYSRIRPLGAPLRTMGGRASGPEPLRNLLDHTRTLILSRQGMRLRPIDVHDIITKIGDIVVVGGTRRSAQISLSDLGDDEMRHAKVGAFWEHSPHRAMANNSAVYYEKPDIKIFMREWIALMESGTGERGIFVRNGSIPERRREILGDRWESLGTNPCGEILLQPKQFCNLSEVVARSGDTEVGLQRKIRIASILGTFQSSLCDFKYLSQEWADTTSEERLLGVSITGQYDCKTVRHAKTLAKLRELAVETNKAYAKRFGIPASTSVTAVKPSGTVSQLVDAASGIHPRYAPFYIRRVRVSSADPLCQLLRDSGVPHFPEVGQTLENSTTIVFEFPRKSPTGAVTTDEVGAIQQLEYWRVVKENYTEHNPSCTIHIKDDEWLEVGAWLYKNWSIIGGLSFLPKDSHVYNLAPYESITEDEYKKRVAELPDVDYNKLQEYEQIDNTISPAACEGAICQIE